MKAGLLPLYIKLYDDTAPGVRPRLEAFYERIAASLEAKGVEILRSPFCRVEPEFAKTVADFEAAGADAIITLHMAYSPSLEAVDVLKNSSLPVIVLDTTETLEFSNLQSSGEIMYNHGIHGVMDLCSMLIRRDKPFAIAAGHYASSDCLDRVVGYLRAAIAAKALGNTRVGLIGGRFAGMGDFTVPQEEMKTRFGIETVELSAQRLAAIYDAVTGEEAKAERSANEALCDIRADTEEAGYEAYLRACVAVEKCLREEKLTAFSATFLGMGREKAGIPTMPFMACCKAMERGVGYAGEGDTLTASFIGALLQGWQETTFVEIFCPDWKNQVLFLSHMGEVNYRIRDTRPLLCKNATCYSGEYNPYAAYTRMKGGKGVYVNICRGREDFKLVLSDAEMLSYEEDTFPTSMRGWMKPGCSVAEFLEAHSRQGATHHSAFVYGATVEQLRFFGALLGLETVVI